MTDGLADDLVDAWGSWGPSMTPDAARVAYVSDRGGVPEAWVQEVVTDGELPAPVRIAFDDPVITVSWSADSRWLGVMTATHGGVRTQVWVVRPDGSDRRRIAGDEKVHAVLGPWTRSGHRVVVRIMPQVAGKHVEAYLANPTTGTLEPLAEGPHVTVFDLSVEERLVVLGDGRRGEEFCSVVDRVQRSESRLIRGEGSTQYAFIRPAPGTWDVSNVAYLRTNVGLDRIALVGVPIDADGVPGLPQTLAIRADAELELMDSDDAGSRLLLVWNASGRSELEIYVTATGERVPIDGLPGEVVTTPVLSRDGDSVLVAVEDPHTPRALWHLDTVTHAWTRVTDVPSMPPSGLVDPTLETVRSRDGLEFTGWLYRVPGRVGPGPAVVFLHGGPESQERPIYSAQKQALVRAGFTVFAPNVRGSGGQGRVFEHLDVGALRPAVVEDVIATHHFLIGTGIAFADRIGVVGRSYGGYLALSTLAFEPELFAAGVDLSGMSDLLSFFRETDPEIADAAISKYGHPRRDRRLMRRISPLRHAESIIAPLLVVHGQHDTNVPVGESRRLVSAIEKNGREVEFLLLAGEGHDYLRAATRTLVIERMVAFLTEAIGAPPLAHAAFDARVGDHVI